MIRYWNGVIIAVLILVVAPVSRADAPDGTWRSSIDIRDSYDFRFLGAEVGDELGVQAHFADLDGDSFDDVVLGAWLADGVRNERPRSGEVHIFFGRPVPTKPGDSIDASVIYGGRPGDRIGSSVNVGDFNNDGIEDLLVGARYANGPADSLRHRGGEVFLLLGGATSEERETIDLRRGADITLLGAHEEDRLGRRIHVSDLDGDGADDLLIAAIGSDGPFGEEDETGAVYIFYGDVRRRQLGIHDLQEVELPVLHGSDESDGLGSSMATGDWNGDGHTDVILGCGFADGPANGRTNAGETYVLFGERGKRFFGSKTVAEGSEFTIYGVDPYDAAGLSIAAGDLDGDGIDDIALGANLADGPGNMRDKCGETYILLGSRAIGSDQMLELQHAPDVILYGAEAGDQLGSVLQLFDWNGDMYDDLVVSSLLQDGPGESREDAGMLYVMLGGRQGDMRSRIDFGDGGGDLILLGPTPDDRIANSLTPAKLAGRSGLLAATMRGDGPNDARRDSGEIYFLQWERIAGAKTP